MKRYSCSIIALLALLVAGLDAQRLLVLPGPSSRSSLTSLYKLSTELSSRGYEVLFATSHHDAAVMEELRAGAPAGPALHLYQPYGGPSNLTLPVWLNAKAMTKKDAIQKLESKPKDDTEAWVHKLRHWYAANCEAVMGGDEQLMAAMKAFKPTHVIGDSAFVCFSHVADVLGDLPRIAVAVSLMPPLEKTLYGMTESFFEIPVYRSGLPRHMSTSHLFAQGKAHMSVTGSVKRTFRQLDDIARIKYNISTGKTNKDPETAVAAKLQNVQALVIGLDPLLTAIPVQLPPHVHVVGPMTQRETVTSRESSGGRQVVLLHVATWSAGPSALSALLTAASKLMAKGRQFQLFNGLPPQALIDKLGAEQQAVLQSLAAAGNGQLTAGAAALVCEASQSIVYEAGFAGVPLVAMPLSGDQLDQAARAEEVGVAVVLRKPAKDSKTSNPQTDVDAIQAAIEKVAGSVSGASTSYSDAAMVLVDALHARRRHPVQAAADVIELSIQRHAASAKLSQLTGIAQHKLLQKPGHADGSNLVMTTAFAVGFILTILATLASQAVKQKAAEVEAAEKKAKEGEQGAADTDTASTRKLGKKNN